MQGPHTSLQNTVRLFEIRSMNDGRKSQIVLLDDRRLEITIQPKLYASELLDLVASQCQLKEKQYFGLGFLDETHNFVWLQGEKRVLDHEFGKKPELLVFYFAIKFYVDTIRLLRDVQTMELFYLNARQLLYQGHLHCGTEAVLELAALVLQATHGDFICVDDIPSTTEADRKKLILAYSEQKTKEGLKKLPVIPTYTLQEHPSIDYCEEKVISYYGKMSGTSRGQAIINYMSLIERQKTYGIHYFDVKDKKNIPWWLGISANGIAVYDKADKTSPRKLFNWKTVENIYYRDKRFSVEVRGYKRVYASYRSVEVSSIDVHTWFTSTEQLTKCIWSMAVHQHKFHLDCRQSLGQSSTARSISEIATRLSKSTTSLPGSLDSGLNHSCSSHSLLSLCNSTYELTVEKSDSLRAERDMYKALKARRDALQESLRKKTEELKLLCVKEGELTGMLPSDIPLCPGERPPVIRRRVGTSFSLSVKNVQDADQLSNDLSKLELEVELQDKITAAASRLASDRSVAKYVRRQRKQSYVKAVGKLNDMQKKLDSMRIAVGKYSFTNHHSARSLDADLDDVHMLTVHDCSSNRRDDSCGNSINSVDFSMGSDFTDSKGASSGYYSPSVSSISSRSCRLLNDEMSSFCDSSRRSTVKSVRDNIYSDTDSMDLEVKRSKAFTLTLDDDQSGTLTRSGRKHFIISRGPQNNRVQELSDGLDMSKSSVSIKSEQKANSSHLAMSESDLDFDSTLNDSFMGNDTFDDCDDDDDDQKEEGKVCTRVERRRLTFIASRGLMKNFHSDMKYAGIEKGWETFQHILMGEDIQHQDVHTNKRHTSSTESDNIHQNNRNCTKCSGSNGTEFQNKIKQLIDSADATTPLVRSRSLDYSRDLRVNESNSAIISKSKDDTKLVKTQSKSKNPFTFLTQKCTKPKQIRHVQDKPLASACYGCATAVVTSHFNNSSVRPPVDSHHGENSNRHVDPSRYSQLQEVPVPGSHEQYQHGLISKDSTHHIHSNGHFPRSTLRTTKSSFRTVDSKYKHWRKASISTTVDSCSHQHSSTCASTSKDSSKKTNSAHLDQQYPKRRPSWHSNNRSYKISTTSTETTV